MSSPVPCWDAAHAENGCGLPADAAVPAPADWLRCQGESRVVAEGAADCWKGVFRLLEAPIRKLRVWNAWGVTVEDPGGYRFLLCRRSWSSQAWPAASSGPAGGGEAARPVRAVRAVTTITARPSATIAAPTYSGEV